MSWRTRQDLIKLLRSALDSAICGDDEMLDRCLIELAETPEEDDPTIEEAMSNLCDPRVTVRRIRK